MFVFPTNRNVSLDDGVWFNYGGSSFKICHTSSSDFQRTLSRLQAPFRKQIEKGTMDPAETKRIVCESLSKTILKDWKNVVDLNGQAVTFTKDLAFLALMNSEDLREFVQESASDLANFKESEKEEMGNV